MKLSNETLEILRNYALINSGILIKKGTVLSTVSPQKNILAVAKVSDDFPATFAIYDLNNFLSVLSMHKDNVELEFDDHHIIFVGKGGRSKIKYRFTDAQMIVTPPDKQIKLPTIDVQFDLDVDDLAWVSNAAKVLQSPNVAIESDGEKINLVTFDASKDDAHKELLEIADGNGDSYRLVFKTENFNKIYPCNYNVEVSSKGISKFVGLGKDISYWIALEQKESKFDGKETDNS